MMSKEELYGALMMLALTLVLGAIGSGLEALGNANKLPWLVSFGKKIEALGQDVPKLAGKPAPDENILKAEVRAEKQSSGTWPIDPPLL
jgi:hypothetical protein